MSPRRKTVKSIRIIEFEIVFCIIAILLQEVAIAMIST